MSGRDWASLPSPLLWSVAKRLIPIAYARVLAVCTLWASALSPQEWEEGQRQPYYLPRSLHCPWLMVPSEDDEPAHCRTFLSLTESFCPYRIGVPELHGKYVFGSHAGWLAAIDVECNMCLINPLTRTQIPLPSITTINFPGFHRVEVIRDALSGSPIRFRTYSGKLNLEADYTPEEFRPMYFRKITLSSSPSSSPGDFIVAFIFHHVEWLAFARAGDTAWSVVPPKPYNYMDAVFFDRKLYAVAGNGQIDAYDFTQNEPQHTVVVEKITMDCYRDPRYLVFSSGDLLHVKAEVLDNGIKKLGFSVEKINLEVEGKKRPVPVNDLGWRSIFIGQNHSLSIRTEEIPGVRHNCIYFTDDYYYDFMTEDGRQRIRDMGVFDIKEGICKALYPPSTWLTWPPPIWYNPLIK